MKGFSPSTNEQNERVSEKQKKSDTEKKQNNIYVE
jgi:hypothetical protein